MTKKFLIPLLAAAIALGGAASASAQQLKIGTVDMKKVFESYYKTKDAEQRINEQRNAAKKELEDRVDEYKRRTEEVQKLTDEIERPELSKEAKDGKRKLRDDRVNELKTMDREIREFQATREKQLQEQSVRMRSGIVEEINKVVSDRVKADQYDLVIDRSGPSLNGVPLVLYSQEKWDFTTDIITALNKNKGSEKVDTSAALAPATPAATPKAKRK
jgi:outer membrane protein